MESVAIPEKKLPRAVLEMFKAYNSGFLAGRSGLYG